MRTLYSTALLTTCMIVLQSPTEASAEAIDPTATANSPAEIESSAIDVGDRAVSDTAFPQPTFPQPTFPQPTLRSAIPQIEFGEPIEPLTEDTAQPPMIQPEALEGGEAIAPPEVIDQRQFSNLQSSGSLAPVSIAPESIEILTGQAEPAPLEPSADPLQPQPAEPTEPVEAERFGTRGQRYLYVQGGGSVSFDRDDDSFAGMGLAGVGITDFFASGHSINLELNGLGFIQPGEDALGLNLGLLFRWHFVRQEDFSLYVDGGAGLLGTTSQVPEDGSAFNFTPQVGIGATFPVQDENHLMVGLRWHHISNANLYDPNPGRDSILLYFGLSRPR